MNRLGGDIVRKIAHLLEAEDEDKAVIHLAMTCKATHRHLSAHLARLRQIYYLSSDSALYNTRKRIKWLVDRANSMKSNFINQSVMALLPNGYRAFKPGVRRVKIRVGGWRFILSFDSIIVINPFCQLEAEIQLMQHEDGRIYYDENPKYDTFRLLLEPIMQVYLPIFNCLTLD
jgi:hypothetical protein